MDIGMGPIGVELGGLVIAVEGPAVKWILRGRAVVAYRPHKAMVAGSNPAPATRHKDFFTPLKEAYHVKIEF